MSTPDFGWNDYVDQTGKPCVYCGEPSTQTLAVEEDQYRGGELVKRGKRVGVCPEHEKQPEGLSAAMTFRRRRAKDVEQLDMDVGDGRAKGPNHAIYGHDR